LEIIMSLIIASIAGGFFGGLMGGLFFGPSLGGVVVLPLLSGGAAMHYVLNKGSDDLKKPSEFGFSMIAAVLSGLGTISIAAGALGASVVVSWH
jgi:hypothetical protein